MGAIAAPPGSASTADCAQKQSTAAITQPAKPLAHSNLYQRTNVARLVESNQAHGELWKYVPGDLIEQWQPSYFDTRSNAATPRQLDERNFYVPCARCRRRISQIKAEGPVNACSESPNFCGFERRRNPGHQTSGVHRT